MELTRRSRVAVWSALSLVLAAGAATSLWFGLPVRSIEVRGNSFLSTQRAAELAGVNKDFGWVYYGDWRAGALHAHPWVREATITREWPDRVVISLKERKAGARLVQNGRPEMVIDLDGTPLPGAAPAGPLIRGWGPRRIQDAIRVAALLKDDKVQWVGYSPSGLTAHTATGSVWAGSFDTLQRYVAAVRQYPDKHVYVYPWGVTLAAATPGP